MLAAPMGGKLGEASTSVKRVEVFLSRDWCPHHKHKSGMGAAFVYSDVDFSSIQRLILASRMLSGKPPSRSTAS